MTFILAPERDIGPDSGFHQYREYLWQNESRFPRSALALSTSDWYFDPEDHRSPHDAWLLSAHFEEVGIGQRREKRSLSLRLRLLGAYHDLELEFIYNKVFSYNFRGGIVEGGHGDWRYDEFRVTDNGHLLHEIQWCSFRDEATWVIEADDIAFSHREAG